MAEPDLCQKFTTEMWCASAIVHAVMLLDRHQLQHTAYNGIWFKCHWGMWLIHVRKEHECCRECWDVVKSRVTSWVRNAHNRQKKNIKIAIIYYSL